MKQLIEIGKIVTKKKVRKIEIFDDATLKNTTSKFSEFYESLVAGKFKNDRDAAKQLYASDPSDDKYRQLKSRFRKRLLNTLFFLDINEPHVSTYDRAYFSCNKSWTLVKILISNKADVSAESEAKSILNIALKFHFSDIIINACRILRKYAADQGNQKEFEYYSNLVAEYNPILEAEIKAESFQQEVSILYSDTISDPNEVSQKIDNFANILVQLSEQYPSPIIMNHMFMVWVSRYEMLKDFDGMIQVANQAGIYDEAHKEYNREEVETYFLLKKISAYLHIGNLKDGKSTVEKALKKFEVGTETWYLFMEYYFLLCMHTQSTIQGIAIYGQAVQQSKFKKLSSTDKDKWAVFQSYLFYQIERGAQTSPLIRAHAQKPYNFPKNSLEIQSYGREVRIFYIYQLFAQISLLILEGNFDHADLLIDSLKTQTIKTLRKEEYFRPLQFAKLLIQLSKANYELSELSNVEKYYDRLLEQPFFYRGMIHELEVIPFELHWKMLVEDISKRTNT